MAGIKGTGGSVNFTNGATIEVVSWSGTVSSDTVDIPPNIDETIPLVQSEIAGIRFSASITGKLSTSAAPISTTNWTQAAKVQLNYGGTSRAIKADVIASNLAINRRKADVDVTFDVMLGGSTNTGTNLLSIT